MQPAIQIVAVYPDLGECPLHFREVLQICLDRSCSLDKYCCQNCLQLHRSHILIDPTTYAKDLATKLTSVWPPEQERKQALLQSFAKLQKITTEFQAKLEQACKILKEIKMKQYEVIVRLLKLNEIDTYEYLCELNLRQNGNAVEELLRKLMKMNLNHPAAPKHYENGVRQIEAGIRKFNAQVENLVYQALQVSSLFDFKSVLEEIDRDNEREKQRVQEKQQKPKKQKVNGELPAVHINLKQQDLVHQQILARIMSFPPESIVSIDIDTNCMNSEALSELFSPDLEYSKLENLNMSNNYLDSTCLEILLNSKIPNLRSLNLEGNTFQHVGGYSEQVQQILAKWPGINLML